MKYSEVGFRNFYHNYISVPITNNLKKVVKDFPGADNANYILTYGYIDHTAGMTLEVLALATKSKKGFIFEKGNSEFSSKIRIGAIMEEECFCLDDNDGRIHNSHADKIYALRGYDVSDDIEESRKMDFLDTSRSPEYPDDVLVYLFKDGNEPEGCWVRIEVLAEHQIIGILLNEPNQDFGCHVGESIAFYAQQTEEKDIVLCSNMTPSLKIKAEDLEDGTLL